jgi:hypothetical protein
MCANGEPLRVIVDKAGTSKAQGGAKWDAAGQNGASANRPRQVRISEKMVARALCVHYFFLMSNTNRPAETEKDESQSKRIEFWFNGFFYRTNLIASIVEARDGATWNRTHSLAVRDAALQAISQKLEEYEPWQETRGSETFYRVEELARRMTEIDHLLRKTTLTAGYTAERFTQAEKIVKAARKP